MKKIFLSRRNALLTQSGVSAGVLIIIAVVVIAGVRLIAPGVFIAGAAPVLTLGAALTAFTADITASFSDIAELRREHDDLQRAYAALTNENLALQAKIEDLARLQGEAAESPGLVASVLARPPESPYDTLILASGSTNGVSVGMRVFAPGNVPLGEVESVTASSARVILYSTPGRSIEAWVGGERTPVTLMGLGGGAYVGEAPKDAGIEVGDIAFTAGDGALPLGRVGAQESSPASPSATIAVASLANLFSLVWVRLVP